MRLIPIKNYNDYRYEVIFKAYKWDPQVYDENTIARNALLIDLPTAKALAKYAEGLSLETSRMEEALLENPAFAKELGIPKKTLAHLKSIKGYNREEHVRLMRFDFHPTKTKQKLDGISNAGASNRPHQAHQENVFGCGYNWVISEVNSDVPAGMADVHPKSLSCTAGAS